MPYSMGGTICEPTDQTTYCEFSRNFHMFTMIVILVFGIDFVLGGTLQNWVIKKWASNLKNLKK